MWAHLAGVSDYLALCHWNANVDNAWFWRDTGNTLHCGLMDWGCVSQMNVAMAIWGAMSGAETSLWNDHLDELLHLFITEIRNSGGPPLVQAELRSQVVLYAAIMGIAWLLGVPVLIRSGFGESPNPLTRRDTRIKDDESVRAPLQMFTNFLNLWETHDFGGLLDAVLA